MIKCPQNLAQGWMEDLLATVSTEVLPYVWTVQALP